MLRYNFSLFRKYYVWQTHYYKTRKDPLADIWKSELLPLLDKEPTLTGLTLWEHLDDTFPEEHPYDLLRTLQLRVASYKLEYGLLLSPKLS